MSNNCHLDIRNMANCSNCRYWEEKCNTHAKHLLQIKNIIDETEKPLPDTKVVIIDTNETTLDEMYEEQKKEFNLHNGVKEAHAIVSNIQNVKNKYSVVSKITSAIGWFF